MSSHWLKISVFLSAQCLALVKARDEMVTSLLAIKTSPGPFLGMEALVTILLHTASFRVTAATCKLPLGMLCRLS